MCTCKKRLHAAQPAGKPSCDHDFKQADDLLERAMRLDWMQHEEATADLSHPKEAPLTTYNQHNRTPNAARCHYPHLNALRCTPLHAGAMRRFGLQ